MVLRFHGSREDTLFFAAQTLGSGPVLWRSQGTPETTHPLPGAGASLTTVEAEIAVFENRLLLALLDETAGHEPHALPLVPAWRLARVDEDGREEMLGAGSTVTLPRQHPG